MFEIYIMLPRSIHMPPLRYKAFSCLSPILKKLIVSYTLRVKFTFNRVEISFVR